ncbi:MAG: ComF family protein [Sphingomonadales bacterium]|nr:MAG: ComF family protein [Sphingomonadales bacterium]
MTLGRVLQSAARGALDLVLPPLCLACREQVRDPGTFCARCWGQLRFLGAPCCAQCGAPFPHEVAPGLRCAACLASPPPYAAARACWRYGDAAAAAIVAFKHADRTEHAQALARHMLRVGAELLEPPDSVLAPVPLHWRRLWRRGYNQAALLATALAGMSGRPAVLDALVRKRATPSQQGLNRQARARNVARAFVVNPARRKRLAGTTVVLIDDVLTTGATVDACCRALLGAGVRDVRVLTVARVADDHD